VSRLGEIEIVTGDETSRKYAEEVMQKLKE